MILRYLTLSALLTTLLMISKYFLGFIPGIEIVTFICILYGTLLPGKLSFQIVITFIFLTGIMYGFGPGGIWYGIIFPTETCLSKLVRKFLLKSKLIFALWCGLGGFAICGGYFLYDGLFFGLSKAYVSLALALIPNLLGAVANFTIALVLIEPCQTFFKNHLTFYHHNYGTLKF